MVCQTDKSGRFCVQAGLEHVKNDRKVTIEEQEEVERAVNGHVRWWGAIWGLGSNRSQESRCLSNFINHGLGTCPMTLLIKDHKTWSLIPKTRSVMGGNEGANFGISKFLSLVLEPVAKEQDDKMEISATNDLLADITDLNDELDEERRNVSTPEEEMYTLQEEESSHEGAMPNQEGDHDVADQSVDGEVPDHHQDDHTARGEKTGHYSGSHCSTQQDIRQFLKHGRKGEPSSVSNHHLDDHTARGKKTGR